MLQTVRTTTGIPSLDQLLEGGFPKGRSFLVTGEPGTGKSIFALQFVVEGLKRGERCIFVTADEEPGDVIEQAASIGWDLERHVENKELAILNAGAYLSALPGANRERHDGNSEGNFLESKTAQAYFIECLRRSIHRRPRPAGAPCRFTHANRNLQHQPDDHSVGAVDL